MNETSLRILLPRLRGPLPAKFSGARAGQPPAEAVRLWPGLPDVPREGRFCPENWPFSPGQAAACLGDMRSMGEAALSGLCIGGFAADNARLARHAAEAALCEALTGSGGNTGAAGSAASAREDLIVRQQAQKALLWVWLQEERLEELAALAAGLEQSEKKLAAVLGGQGQGAALRADTGLVPPWRFVTASAVRFLPPEAVIVAEDVMAGELAEILDFVPLSPHSAEDAPDFLEARAPAWAALGRSRPAGDAALDAPRVWRVRRSA